MHLRVNRTLFPRVVQAFLGASLKSFLKLKFGDGALGKSANKRQKAPTSAGFRDGPNLGLRRRNSRPISIDRATRSAT